MRNTILATALAALVVTGSATAAERTADDLPYMRVGAGVSDAGSQLEIGTETAYSIGAGWRFANHYSIDLNHDHLGSWDGAAPGIGGPLDGKARTFSLGLGGTIDLGQSGFFGQARVGAHRWTAEYENFSASFEESGTDPFYAVAVGYDIGDRLGVLLSYERFVIDNSNPGDVDRLMLGFELRLR